MRLFQIASVGWSCAFLAAAVSIEARAAPKPRLVVWVTVDSLGTQTLLENQGDFRFGLKQLLDEGAVFPYASYPYAQTLTAVGHTTLATGTMPRRHGIVGNHWLDSETGKVTSVFADKSRPGAYEPTAILSETLSDRLLLATEKRARSVAIAFKPYAAVPLAGKLGHAYWFNSSTGDFTSSPYYGAELPSWVRGFSAKSSLDKWLGGAWQPLQKESLYRGPKRRTYVGNWFSLGHEFPHAFPLKEEGSSKAFYEAVASTPLFFDVQVEFAVTAMRELKMGKDETPDLLSLSFASIDTMSHLFGPKSWEVQDSLRRLDVALGRLLQEARAASGGRFVFVLQADHGAAPCPEEVADLGWPAQRVLSTHWFKVLSGEIEREQKVLVEAHHEGGNVFFHWKTAGLSEEQKVRVRSEWARKMRQHPSVALAVSKDDLFSFLDSTGLLPSVQLSFHPERSGDVMVLTKPYHLLSFSSDGAFHGSPYRYDSEVPVVFLGKGIPSGWRYQRVSTLDVAPTLAAAMRLGTPADSEGNILADVLAKD